MNSLRLLISAFIFYHAVSINAQPNLVVHNTLCDSLTFSKISPDETGIWAISGDSNKVYRISYDNTIREYKGFRNLTDKKFTCILARPNSVLVGTAGDYFIKLINGEYRNLREKSGILNGYITSMTAGDSTVKIATNKGIFEGFYDSIFYNVMTFYEFPMQYKSFLIDKGEGCYYYNYKYNYVVLYHNVSLTSYFSQIYNSNHLPNSVAIDPLTGQSFIAEDYGLFLLTSEQRLVTLLNSQILTLEMNDKYCLAGGKSGLFVTDGNKVDQILGGYVINQLVPIGTRGYIAATNKGILVLRNDSWHPVLTSPDTLVVCLPTTTKITNTCLWDSITWYRNDVPITNNISTSCTISEEGEYYAKIKNSFFKNTIETKVISANPNHLPDSYVAFDNWGNKETIKPGQFNKCAGIGFNLTVDERFVKRLKWFVGDIDHEYSENSSIRIYSPGLYIAFVENCNGYSDYIDPIQVESISPMYYMKYSDKQSICSGDTLWQSIYTNAHSILNSGKVSIPWDKIPINTGEIYSFELHYAPNCVQVANYQAEILGNPFAWIGSFSDTLRASPFINDITGETRLSFTIDKYQWYLNGSEIPGENKDYLITHKDGIYKVLLIDSNGCSNFSNEISLSYNEISLNAASWIKLYPNPNNGIFMISCTSNIKCVEVFNMLGEQIYKTNNLPQESVISVGHHPPGQYLLKVETEERSTAIWFYIN
jgi:hypothetical protein